MSLIVNLTKSDVAHSVGMGLRRLLPDRLETVVLLLLAAGIAWQLFIEPVVGMANNADFARLIWPAGIGYKSSADYWETVFRFSETKFVFVAPKPFRYLTSERPILGVALLLNHLVSKDGTFNLQVLGFCNLALYLGALAIFLRAFRSKRLATRILVAASALVMCADVKWIAYFNSFYSESASLIFLFSTLGLALLCTDPGGERRVAWLGWLAYMTSAFLFWTAKSQNIAFAPCLVAGSWYFFPNTGRTLVRLAGAVAIPLCIVWALASGAYADTSAENTKVVMTEEILPNSPTPDADRKELGAENVTPSLARIARFYLHHPVRWWQMAQRRSKEAFGYIPYGNFSKASGLGPGAQSHSFNVWSEFKKARYPKNLTLLLCLFLAFCVLAGMKARWLDEDRATRMRTLVGPVLAVGCALEFMVSVTFEANGTAKHLFIFNVAVDLCLVLAMLSLGEACARLWRRKSATPPAQAAQ